MCNYENVVLKLNSATAAERLSALRELKNSVDKGEIEAPLTGEDVNNHIHTIYSFSPYSPAKAVWTAYINGLCTAGIMDHDSISGAREFIEAGKIIGMPVTVGMECRVSFKNTPLAGRKINNPDQNSCVYMAMHGIPHTQIDAVSEFFAPYRAARNERNRKIIQKINARVKAVSIDFEKDVLPLSRFSENGGVTERHLLFALSLKLIEKFGKGEKLVAYLKSEMNLSVSSKAEAYLLDESNAFYAYDLLGVLKSDISQMYIDATDECPDVRTVLEFSNKIGAVSAYAYLGDVGSSVTGDKRAQKFEDDYLDELFEVISQLGYKAVTYMPSRNTAAQLERVRGLCNRYGLFQISGEDINSPRQLFICKALQNPEYHNLVDSTWALIGHEKAATEALENGMFSAKTIKAMPELSDRIVYFGKIGKK